MRSGVLRVRGAIGAAFVVGGVAVAISCRAPTQVKLIIRTDMPCGVPGTEGYGIRQIFVYAGPDKESVLQRVGQKPEVLIDGCTKSGELGSLYLYRDKSETAYVHVVASLGHRDAAGLATDRRAASCPATATSKEAADKCLVTTRKFTYSENATGYLTVSLTQNCVAEWWTCVGGKTCIEGECEKEEVEPSPNPPSPLPGPDASVKDAGIPEVSLPDAPLLLLDEPVSISVGEDHVCARHKSGRVRCWGGNGNGQLGNGSTKTPASGMGLSLPVVNLGGGATLVVAGPQRTCAAVSNGKVLKCWGRNEYGELGIDSTNKVVDLSKPQAGPPFTDAILDTKTFATIDDVRLGGHHTCIRSGEKLGCWGLNNAGQLGNDGATGNLGGTPGSMKALSPINFGGPLVASVDTGNGHTCAVLDYATGRSVRCWGNNVAPADGILGIGSVLNALGPALVDLGTDVHPRLATPPIALGANHACVLVDIPGIIATEGIKCWGDNSKGQAGLPDLKHYGGGGPNYGPMGDALPYVALPDGFNATSVVAGTAHSCALSKAGEVRCWGDNSFGQLGSGEPEPYSIDGYSAILGGKRFAMQIAAGGNTTCALLDDKSVKCWGSNSLGQLGLPLSIATIGKSGDMGTLKPVDLELYMP